MDVRWMRQQPYWALVDDDSHSARLMTRMLLAQGSPAVRWMDGAASASAELGVLLADTSLLLPSLVIVDLRASSGATASFIDGLRKLSGATSLLVAAMAPTLERETRETLLRAGADAVFQRHAELGLYRREAGDIVSFWARNQRLEAVGT